MEILSSKFNSGRRPEKDEGEDNNESGLELLVHWVGYTPLQLPRRDPHATWEPASEVRKVASGIYREYMTARELM